MFGRITNPSSDVSVSRELEPYEYEVAVPIRGLKTVSLVQFMWNFPEGTKSGVV